MYMAGGFSRLIVIGLGKASPAMARAIEESLGDLVDSGIVITKYGHGDSQKRGEIRLFEAGHPIPDENGRKAAEEIIDLVQPADEKTLVVCLISGGGSSLFVSPTSCVSLAEKQITTDLLLKAGAEIGELNTVRKHLSRVKGGGSLKSSIRRRLFPLSCPMSSVTGLTLSLPVLRRRTQQPSEMPLPC